MTQAARDEHYKAEFGRRLSWAVGQFGLSWRQLSGQLGYENPSTLRQAAQGRTLMSAERLAVLGRMQVAGGQRLSLDWLLTGVGSPFVAGSARDELEALLAGAPPEARADVSAYLRIKTALAGPANTGVE